MACPFSRGNNRKRFQSSSIPISTKYAAAFSSGSNMSSSHDSGAGKALRSTDGNDNFHRESAHSSISTAATGINENAFSSLTIPIDETVPSENRTSCGGPSFSDGFTFEAKDSDDIIKNNHTENSHTAENCSASRTRAIKSGRRSGNVPAQPTLFTNDSFQPFDHHCKPWKNQCSDFDRFLFEQWKSSSWQDAHEDVHRQFHSWDPFQAQTTEDEDPATNDNNNHYSNTPYSPGIGDSVFNQSTNEVELLKRNVPDTMAGTRSGGGAEFNGNDNFSDNLAGYEHCEPKAREIGDIHGTEHGAFVFTALKPKRSVTARGVQEFQSSKCFEELDAARVSCHGLKNNCGRGSDSVFAAEGHVIQSSFVSSSTRSTGESTARGSIPSIFTASSGGKLESESKGNNSRKQNPLVEHPASTGAPSPLFGRVSEKNTVKGAASDGVHGRSGIAGIFSPLESSTPKDSLSEWDKSWHFADDSPSTSSHMFEFGAYKGHNARRKGSMKSMPSSNDAFIGHLGHHTGGDLTGEFSPCTEAATEDAPVAYHDMPGLEHPFMPWDYLFKAGHENPLNLHQSIGSEKDAEERRGADANFHTVIDQQINAEHFHQGESPTGGEHQSRWNGTDEGECGIPTGSNRWKSLFDERISAASSGNDWFSSAFEKLRTDNFENSNSTIAAKVDASSQRRLSAFAASSRLSSSALRPARKSHRPNATLKKSDRKLESSFGMRPFWLQTEIVRPSWLQTEIGQGHVPGRKGDLSDPTAEKEKIAVEASYRFLDPIPATGLASLLSDQGADSGLATSPVPVKSAISEQVCEKWRLRGNQAYANGDFTKAEEYYSCGVSCISPRERSKSCIRARMLCYSNRAAARMAVGRMREALTDCMQAMDIDSKFVRAQIRAASCHLALGECDAALKLFKECMGSRDEPETLGVKIVTEALEGIRNVEQVEENMNEAVKLLNAGKSEDASNALCAVNKALSISPHSESLLELKARALLSLCNHEKAIQVCKESMVSMELNHKCGNCITENPMGNKDIFSSQCYCHIKLQFWQMTGKAHFHLGELDQALNSLLKYEEANSAAGRSGEESMETLAPLVATINDLLYHKAAGNEAFQVGKYAEAVEHYTAALACNNESRPFTAVLFCNRAAASHGLGHIVDGIADCSRAIAIEPEYPKAFSRRAILHEMIRNYGQTINDLQRLITLQERQEQQVKGNKSRRFGSLGNNTQDLIEARERLAKAEEDLKKGNLLDHYLILGVEPSCTTAEIKKAYRKAALKHHPDKAGQFIIRSDNGDDALHKEFGDEFRRDAEKLFKMIGEAYAVLSEPDKRLHYDTEEELRKLRMYESVSGAVTVSEPSCYQYGKNNRCHREGFDSWNGCKNQYQHWQSGPDTSQPNTCTFQGSNNSRFNDHDWDNI